tara:strand:+ start:295 stop:867 length:573 start_codon:yes stop_codon:yes gene_type:complete
MTGFFDRCGGHSCPPHFQTNDQRTPTAYENKDYVDALHKFIDTDSKGPLFTQKGDVKEFLGFFEQWFTSQVTISRNIGKQFLILKHPLQIFVLDQIEPHFEPKYIVLTRSLEKIEQTRVRRNWPEVFGKKGASILYSEINTYFEKKQKPFFPIEYEQFLTNEKNRKELLIFCELEISTEKIKEGEDWLRS